MLNADIRRVIHGASGLNLSASTVARAVRDRMKQCAIDCLAEYRDRLGEQDELSALLELVVVHETWLFRDPDAFIAASDFVQQRLATLDRPLRILSLPCSSGEEPYSIAISLVDAGIPASHVVIDAMDISADILAQARQGVYGPNSFRSSDLAFRDRHFVRTGQLYALDPAIRRMVTFSQGNLLDCDRDAMAGRFDMVFCRNLLIYFDEPTQVAAIGALRHLLDDDGLLFAGYAEVPIFFQHGFKGSGYTKAFALRKKFDALEAVAAAPLCLPPRLPDIPSRPQAFREPPKPASIATRSRGRPTRQTQASPPAGPIDQATSLADHGDFAAAATVLLRYLKDVPDSAEAYFLLGLTSGQRGDLKAAEDHLRRAIYLDPDHYDALCHLALLAEQAGNATIAASLKERAARVFGRTAAGTRQGSR